MKKKKLSPCYVEVKVGVRNWMQMTIKSEAKKRAKVEKDEERKRAVEVEVEIQIGRAHV